MNSSSETLRAETLRLLKARIYELNNIDYPLSETVQIMVLDKPLKNGDEFYDVGTEIAFIPRFVIDNRKAQLNQSEGKPNE